MLTTETNYNLRAKFYDIEFNDMSDRDLLASLATTEVKRILEIPCGSGRNCEWLAQTGKEVVFGDLSQEMVDTVNAKLVHLSFPHSARAERVDMLACQSSMLFDLILVPREGIQLLKSTQTKIALENLCSNLSENGFLYIDLAVLDPKLVTYPEKLPKYISQQGNEYVLDIESKNADYRFTRWHQSSFDGHKLSTYFRYEVIEHGREYEYTSTIHLMAYTLTEFESLCRQAGLTILKIYGGYNGDPYKENSERMVFVLKNSYE